MLFLVPVFPPFPPSTADRLLISMLFILSLEFCSFPSFEPHFFVSSFWQAPCVCFYVLGRAAMSPGLGRVALCSWCPVGPRGAGFPVT